MTSDHLLASLDALEALAPSAHRQRLDALRERLAETRLRVLVVGEAKRGKSTLVNALLGRAVLPCGVTPLTALATTVRYGTDEGVSAVFADGRSQRFPLEALDDLVTERGNPRNCRRLSSVTVAVDAPILSRGLEIVDTPGTGSVYAHNTETVKDALPTMDAAVFVLSADPPVSAGERELLSTVAELSVATFVILNKADYLDEPGIAEAMQFTRQVLGETPGATPPVYPVSARAALTGSGNAGFKQFAADLEAYLERGRAADLKRSVAGHVRRIAEALLDEVSVALRAARMGGAQAHERVNAFARRLAAVTASGRDAADLAEAESGRLLAELNAAAEAATARLPRGLRAEFEDFLDRELADAAPGEIARVGRSRLVSQATEAVESWRTEQRERLEDGLTTLDTRLAEGLSAELDAVRHAAAELLGVRLHVPTVPARLVPDQSFFYATGEQVDQAELLIGAVRRRVPGKLGRRLAREHVLAEVADAAATLIGRARADLQYRLAEATRGVVRSLRERYADSTGHLERALAMAAELREQASEQSAARFTELDDRQRALRALLGRVRVTKTVTDGAT